MVMNIGRISRKALGVHSGPGSGEKKLGLGVTGLNGKTLCLLCLQGRRYRAVLFCLFVLESRSCIALEFFPILCSGVISGGTQTQVCPAARQTPKPLYYITQAPKSTAV